MRTGSWGALMAAGLLLVMSSPASADKVARIAITGSPSVNTIYRLRIYDFDGVTVIATSSGATTSTAGQTAAMVAANLEADWDQGADITCSVSGNQISIADFQGRNFRCCVNADNGVFQEITPPAWPVLNGVTFASTLGHVPTLSEWGVLALIAVLVGTALWVLRRRRSATGAAV